MRILDRRRPVQKRLGPWRGRPAGRPGPDHPAVRPCPGGGRDAAGGLPRGTARGKTPAVPDKSRGAPGDPPAPAKPAVETVPITVSGRATDLAGKPVAGATIYLVSTNGINADLGTTTTAADGSYTFRDARLPVRRALPDSPLAGTFQVFGSAPGHGFAWHGMRFYQPEPRPADRRVAGEDHTSFQGEPLVMNLAFPPAATLRGRIVDEAGKPVAGVKVNLEGGDYLDIQGKETHPNFREFWCIQQAPERMDDDEDGW